MSRLLWLALLPACGAQGPDSEAPAGAIGLWLSHDGLASRATAALIDLPPVGVATPLGVAVAQLHDPKVTSAACKATEPTSCVDITATASLSVDLPPLASLRDVPLTITAAGSLAFTEDHPQMLRLHMPDPDAVNLTVGETTQPEMAFLSGLLKGTLLPYVTEQLHAGLRIPPAPSAGTYLQDVTVNKAGLGMLSSAMPSPPAFEDNASWQACANGVALTHLVFPSMLLDPSRAPFEVDRLWREEDRLHVRVKSTRNVRTKPTIEASATIQINDGELTLDDSAVSWAQRPKGLWFGPRIPQLERTLQELTPFSMQTTDDTQRWTFNGWSADGSVLCITGL